MQGRGFVGPAEVELRTLQAPADKMDMYLDFFLEVVRRTAQLVAAWQCVGFCHGAPMMWLCALNGFPNMYKLLVNS